MAGHVVSLSTYPIKGLSARAHDAVELIAGEGFPGDRVMGFAKADSGFDPDNPQPLPKSRFFALYGFEALAQLDTEVDTETGALTIATPGGETYGFDMDTLDGQSMAQGFIGSWLDLPASESPVFASAAPHRFTDVSMSSRQMMHAISVVNLASVRALEDAIGEPVDPARFRANVLVDGWPPFAELDWVERHIQMGDMPFEVLKRTRRCPATQVNLNTGERDLDIPKLLKQHYGHADMGIYVSALSDGVLRSGDAALTP